MAVAALLTLGLVSALPASSSSVSFSVSYSAAADCPNQATFEAAVSMRAPAARKAPDVGAPQVRFEVELPEPSAGKARLRALLRDGTSQDREIVADGCAEAMQSMAVIAAMILEAQLPEPESQPASAKSVSAEPGASELEPKRADRPAPKSDAAPSTRPARRGRGTWLIAGARSSQRGRGSSQRRIRRCAERRAR